ncbi:MAG: glycosyltransferase [candidate division WOR-3 bacterium]
MRVLVIQCIAKLELGGAQKIVLDLVRELKDKGVLITGKGGFLYQNVKEKLGERHITLSCLKREISPLSDILCFFKLRNILITFHKEYDRIILHTHGSKAGIIGRLVSGTLPFVFSVHHIHGFAINPYILFFKRFIYLLAERIASCFGNFQISVSKIHIKKALEWGLSKRPKYIYVPNYVDTSLFKRRSKRNNFIKIGTVANFKPQKNPIIWAKVALKVTSIFKNVVFLYVGDGVLRKKVENLIRGNKRIKLLGWRKDIPDFLSKIDIFFLPSKWEGAPLSILEAMASGLPVVASSVDGIKEVVVDSFTGYLISPNDLNGYVEKLKELIKNKKKRIEMGEEGRKIVKSKFSYERTKEAILKIYESLGLNF